MKWAIPILAAALLSASHAAAADYPVFKLGNVGSMVNLSKYSLAWSDEFTSLDATPNGKGNGPWFPAVHAVMAAGEKMVATPDPAFAAASGVLKLSTRLDPSDGKRVEAHLQTADTHNHVVMFQNGYFEARILLPAARGSHSGFWLLSPELGKGHTEVDVVEAYGVGDWGMHSSTHLWPVAPQTHAYKSNYQRTPDMYAGFHTYGVMANDNQFIFYYDRKEVGRIARMPEQQVPLYVLLSVFGNPAQPIIDNATMLVDYVRVYTPKTQTQMASASAPASLRVRAPG